MQERARGLAGGQDRTVTAGGCLTLEYLDEDRRLVHVTATGGEHEPADHRACVAGRSGDRLGLVQQSRRSIQVAFGDPHPREIGEGGREHAERAGVAGGLNVAGGEQVPRFVIEQLHCDASGHPRPEHLLLVAAGLVADGAQRLLEDRRARRIALGEPGGQTIDEQVGRTRRLWCRRRGASGLGRV